VPPKNGNLIILELLSSVADMEKYEEFPSGLKTASMMTLEPGRHDLDGAGVGDLPHPEDWELAG